MLFSGLIGSHTIFGPQSKHMAVFWTSLAKSNVSTGSTVCFVLGLFHWTHLLVSPDKTPFACRHCPSAPPHCSLALFREQMPCLSWLHLEGSKLLGKQDRHTSEMSDSCILTSCLYYACWG